VTCDRARESISARLDGEPAAASDVHVAAHLSDCTACRDWQERAHRVTRRVRINTALPEPGQVSRVVGAVRDDRHRRRVRRHWVAFGTAVAAAGAIQLLATVPLLVMARARTSGGGRVHTRGLVELAIGAGFFVGALVVLWRDRGPGSDVVRIEAAPAKARRERRSVREVA
jgi:predicted anti-sigma-YlaC factor YlaD